MKIKSYKKNGKTYYAFSVYLGVDELTGKEIRTNRRGFETKKDAEIAYARLRSSGKEKKKCDLTFRQLYELWFDDRSRKLKESSAGKIEILFRCRILPRFGDTRVDRIKLQHIQTFLNDQAAAGYSQCKPLRNYIRAVFRYGLRMELVEKNPCELVELPAPPHREKDEDALFYNKEELQAFLVACREHLSFAWYAFFRTAAYTGMRRAELLALTWDDISDDGIITVDKALSKGRTASIIVSTTKTAAGTRRVSIDAETLDILMTHKHRQREALKALPLRGQLVFPNTRNTYMALSTPIKYLDTACQRAGIKRITLHGLRHTHCSLLFEAGASIKEVQARLGHRDPTTTLKIYTHVTSARRTDTGDRFQQYMLS